MRQGQGEVTIVSWAMWMVENLLANSPSETKNAAINVVDIRGNCSKFDALFTSPNAVKKKEEKRNVCAWNDFKHTQEI